MGTVLEIDRHLSRRGGNGMREIRTRTLRLLTIRFQTRAVRAVSQDYRARFSRTQWVLPPDMPALTIAEKKSRMKRWAKAESKQKKKKGRQP